MKRLLTASFVLGLAIAAQPMFAQEQGKGTTPPPAGKKARNTFAAMDTNKDGKISREEWKGRAKRFDRLDANHDGFLSQEEMRAGRKKKK